MGGVKAGLTSSPPRHPQALSTALALSTAELQSGACTLKQPPPRQTKKKKYPDPSVLGQLFLIKPPPQRFHPFSNSPNHHREQPPQPSVPFSSNRAVWPGSPAFNLPSRSRARGQQGTGIMKQECSGCVRICVSVCVRESEGGDVCAPLCACVRVAAQP